MSITRGPETSRFRNRSTLEQPGGRPRKVNSKLDLLLTALALALVAGVAWLNYINLQEAYGSGPPYFGRTVNMDKWASPLPVLLTLDAVTGLVLIWLVLFLRKRIRSGR